MKKVILLSIALSLLASANVESTEPQTLDWLSRFKGFFSWQGASEVLKLRTVKNFATDLFVKSIDYVQKSTIPSYNKFFTDHKDDVHTASVALLTSLIVTWIVNLFYNRADDYKRRSADCILKGHIEFLPIEEENN
ncbi:MAG: hypothetical protein LBS83_02245 [Holosporales bacterium]|jgi:hypothetical protein|nr:hypothetical protein [Holosporales bacterium]